VNEWTSPLKRSRYLLPAIVVLFCILARGLRVHAAARGTGNAHPHGYIPGWRTRSNRLRAGPNLTYEIRTNTTDGSQYGVCIMKTAPSATSGATSEGVPGFGRHGQPPAVYCEEQNNTYATRSNPTQPVRRLHPLRWHECDSWEYYRRRLPGAGHHAGAGIANPSAVYSMSRE